MPDLRTLLVLGRVSNLPTVWSNCLAGWLMAGGSTGWRLFFLLFGSTLLYIGGMYLNDAFDADFDRQHRTERPIPSGRIDVNVVWWSGMGLLFVGALCLMSLGKLTAFLTFALIVSIILYDAIHKMVAFSPVLMAACRFFLFLVAASTGTYGLPGGALWVAFALAAYIVGLSYIARKESTRGAIKYWPAYLMAVPVGLAFIVNDEGFRLRGMVLSLILILWVCRCVWHTYGFGERNVGRTVSGLLAGIVLVDWLAIGGGNVWQGLIFVLLFAAARLFQRFIRAT